MRKKIAALIPCFNDSDTIDLCIKSVSEFVDRIIVYDDQSDERTKDILHSIHNKKLRIITNTAEQLGWTEARNKLLEFCNYDKLLFIDADDILYENAITYLRDIVYGKYPYVQFWLVELWGDFYCTTGRGVNSVKYDKCHIYLDRSQVDFIWGRRYPMIGCYPFGSVAPHTYREHRIFAHACGVRSDKRIIERHNFRNWIAANTRQPFQGWLTQNIKYDDLHDYANQILFRNPKVNPRRITIDIPKICEENERFRIIWDKEDRPIDRQDLRDQP